MSFCPACHSEYPDDWKRCPKDEASLLAGRNIGKYRVDGLLGVGGMGAVYKAWNPDTKSTVAIKLMHAESATSDASRTRFQREAASVAALKTRHLVTIYDFGMQPSGDLFLVMEFLQGHNLRAEIAGTTGMPIPRIQMVLDGALRGLGAAHKKGIVHRDLKPENIYISESEDGEVAKVLDFGIARISSQTDSVLTKEGALMGTPAYMAPEQVAGNRGDMGPWTDVYAMGVITYEMFTGNAPFHDESVTAILTKVLTRDFEPLEKVRPDLPPQVREVVACAISDHYDDRFADANAFREAWAAAFRSFDPSVADAPVPAFRRTRDHSAVPSNMATPDPMMKTEYPDSIPDAQAAAAQVAQASRGAKSEATADTFLSPAQGVTAPARPSNQSGQPATLTPGPVVVDSPPVQPAGKRGVWLGLLAVILVGGAIATFLVMRGGGDGGNQPDPDPHGGRGGPVADAGTRGGPAPAVDAGPARPADPDGMARINGGAVAMKGFPTMQVAEFWLDRTEMTVAGFRAAMKAAGAPDDQPADADPSLPATGVTWAQADQACRAIGRRLPSEAEWQLAATQHPLDATQARLFGPTIKGPAPVGTHAGDCTPEPARICDLLGNVAEWTADPWRERADDAPTDAKRAVRGGTYTIAAASDLARPTHRAKATAASRDPEVGLRCARDLEP